MTDTDSLLQALYTAFNRRDIGAALNLMTDDVDWPKASEGGRVIGKDEIRAYWTRQWEEFDPHVKPLDSVRRDDGLVEVRVHQLVKDRQGAVLSDQIVLHTYTITGSLVARMEVSEAERAFGR